MDWLNQATRLLSPNCDHRPADTGIDMLVIHSISLPPGEYEHDYVEQFFQNRLDSSAHPYFKEIEELKVSAHLYIRREGRVIQFVPLGMRAWHAGVSSWQGRDKCNDFSIGIELAGCDEEEYTADQYVSLCGVTKQIQAAYPDISEDRILGHSDIAAGRKTDPGPCFDWERYKQMLK